MSEKKLPMPIWSKISTDGFLRKGVFLNSYIRDLYLALYFLGTKVFPFLGLFLFILIEVRDEEGEVMG